MFLKETVETRRHPICVCDCKNICFHKIRLSDTEPPEIDFMRTFSSILESFGEPSLFTYCLVVTPVANTGIVLKVVFRARFVL